MKGTFNRMFIHFASYLWLLVTYKEDSFHKYTMLAFWTSRLLFHDSILSVVSNGLLVFFYWKLSCPHLY